MLSYTSYYINYIIALLTITGIQHGLSKTFLVTLWPLRFNAWRSLLFGFSPEVVITDAQWNVTKIVHISIFLLRKSTTARLLLPLFPISLIIKWDSSSSEGPILIRVGTKVCIAFYRGPRLQKVCSVLIVEVTDQSCPSLLQTLLITKKKKNVHDWVSS